MKRDELIAVSQQLDALVEKATENIPFDYLKDSEMCSILIARWWDEMIPIVALSMKAEKIRSIIDDLTIRRVIKMRDFGFYYVAGYEGNHIRAFSVLGDEDIIRFLLACFGQLDADQKKNTQEVPLVEL